MENTTNEYAKLELDNWGLYAFACYGLIQTYDGEAPVQLRRKYVEYCIKGKVSHLFIKVFYESHDNTLIENKPLIDAVKERTKELKLSLIEAHTVKIYTSRGLNTLNLSGVDGVSPSIDYGQQFDEAYSKRRKAFCMYYHKQGEKMKLVDPEHYKIAIEEFKMFIKKHGMVVSSDDVERKGKKLYAICFGKEDESLCPFSMSCFHLMINGFAYYFFKKENRDKVLAYITK